MPTFIGQTREVVIPNNGSTTDRQPTINVQLSAPMGPNTMLVLYINGTPSMTASVEISPTEYTFSPRCNPGTYAFRVDVIQTDGVSTILGTSPSNVNNVVVEAINQAWSSTINQDGPYAVGNSGSSDPFADFNWEDSFWIAALGNLKGTDLVEWQTTWTPGSDGWNPPTIVVHPGDTNNPWRLEVQAHSGNWNGYSSGILEIELLINGIVQGDKLQLVLNDEPYGYEGATWAVWHAPVPNPFYIRWNYAFNTANLVTDDVLPIEYGAPTPGIPYYILDNGQTVSSAARLMFVADPGSMLQTGDIIVLQGVLHRGTLTGQETSQCLDVAQGIYVPMTRSLDEYLSGAYDSSLQPNGSGGVNWQQLKSDCAYPLEDEGHAFTVAITPVVNTDGFVNSFWAPFFEFTSAELAGFAHGTVLTSKINGVAVYRGGSIAPGNLIYSAVRQDLFTLQTEIRKIVNPGIVAGFTASGNWETNLQQQYTFRVENQDENNVTASNVQVTIDFGPGFTLDGAFTGGDESISIEAPGVVVFRQTLLAGDSIDITVLGSYATAGEKSITISATPGAGYPVENLSDNVSTSTITVTSPRYVVRMNNTSQGVPWYIMNIVGTAGSWTNLVPPAPTVTDIQNAQITSSSGNAHDFGSSANAQLVVDAINNNEATATASYFGSGTTTAVVEVV